MDTEKLFRYLCWRVLPVVRGAGRNNFFSQAYCLIYLIIAATGNTKEWDKSSVHTETKQLPALYDQLRLKRQRKEHRSEVSKHKHDLLMIHLFDLSSSSIATNLPTRYLPVVNWKQQICTGILMRGHWQPKSQRPTSSPRLVRERRQL